MASDDVQAGLRLDLSNLNRDFREASQGATGIDRQFGILLGRMKSTRAELSILEKIEARVAGKILKIVGRAAIGAVVAVGVSEVASALSFPEAISPIVNIGTAAAMGAAFGGPVGAAVGATVATVNELIGAFKAEKAKAEVFRQRIEADRQRIAENEKAIKVERTARESAFLELRNRLLEQVEQETEELAYQSWLNRPE